MVAHCGREGIISLGAIEGQYGYGATDIKQQVLGHDVIETLLQLSPRRSGAPDRLQRWPGVILLRSRTTLVDQERARQYRLFQCPVAMVAGTPRSFGSQVFI